MSRNIQYERQLDYVGNLVIEFVRGFVSEIREEECHGFHRFDDSETKSIEISSIKIELEGCLIDITSRLTKEEIKDLESQLW